MKILFLSSLLSYGGASKLLYDMMPMMACQGHTCSLLILTESASKYVDELRERGFTIDVVPKTIRGHLARIRYIHHYIAQGQYDVVHANLFPTIYYASIVKRIGRKRIPPMMMTEHSTDNKRRHRSYLRPLEQFIYGAYDRVISISEQTQEQLCQWLRAKGSEKFVVIENGIDIERYRSAEAYGKEQLFPDIKPGDVLLLMVGSFTPQKNHAMMLDTLKCLPENYKLLLAGEGPLMEMVQSKAKELQVEHRIAYLGFRKDIPEIMHTADCIVIPSKWEGFGLIAAEAMACHLPIAASDVIGLSDVVGDCGVKFDPDDPHGAAAAILSLEAEEQRRTYIECGARRVEQYSIHTLTQKYLDVYRRLVEAKK